MYSRLLEVMGNVRRVDNSRDMKGKWLGENIRSWAKNFILSFCSLATNLLNKMRPSYGQKNYSTLNIQVHQYIGSQTDAGTKQGVFDVTLHIMLPLTNAAVGSCVH